MITISTLPQFGSENNRGGRHKTLQGVHFIKTPEYVQVAGVGDFTNTPVTVLIPGVIQVS